MSESLKFRISSALKDILGRDLIHDDFIAVFELVKNSFDAYATTVKIKFEKIESGNGRIIIKDDGKGMNYEDLIHKWLFVAYSAKKEGTEDGSIDYRSNINVQRRFAGAKGIGRFSCDKLGEQLYLETTKNEPGANTETLLTNWSKFERDINDEFTEITVLHDTKAKSDYGLQHGTVLIIENLRSEWDRKKYLKLKDSLAKLINPNSGNEGLNFRITIDIPEELDRDNESPEEFSKVNGEVKNLIFETLGLKTTKIVSSISDDGQYLSTELEDGGTLIYKIKELNTFSLLDNVSITLYFLNMSAKQTFTRRMGISSNQYGHIFLYKNGFRIYPYGEPGEDPLKIDNRKTRGINRFLGTRDLIGRIEINSDTDQLKETTSRGDGLIKTPAYYQLEEFFILVLKRLERYVVDVQQWGLSVEDENSYDVKSRISELLAKLTGSENLVEFQTTDSFLNIIESSQANSAETIVKNLNRLALERGDDVLINEVKRATYRLNNLQLAKEQAEKEAIVESERAREATAQLREQISENLFLKSINTSDYQEVIALLHHIGIYAGTIDNKLKGISLRIQNDIPITRDELNNIIKSISFETKKILNVVSFATKANFKLQTEELEADIGDYIRQYIEDIIPSTTDKSLRVEVRDFLDRPHRRVFKPIEVNIVLDNLISNARKARANNLSVTLAEGKNGHLLVKFVDDGIGIKRENLDRIYDLGFTTTDGSGIGLFHVKQIVDSMKAKISAESNEKQGVTFTIEFK